MDVEICFDGYLRSLVSDYQQWWRLYTLTDATGRESQRVEREQIAPAFFDFGLMVQTVELPKAEQERESEQEREKKEKIERLPVLDGICKYAADHVLLVGRPGSGKSTALARLLLQEAEKALEDRQAKIPVLVELRYLPSEANESSVIERILAFIHKHDPALDIDEAGIKQLLRQGRLLLLVDGVNELPSDRGRAQVNQFRELYQKTCPMIFTTREMSAGGDLGIAKRLEMQPLTEPQMQQFMMAYLPTQGEGLLRQLSGRLREFGQTPLLLWMLCSLFQQSEQIPPNLGMVFRAFTVGYGDRIKQDVTLSKHSRTWWGRLLQYLAFKMTCGENLTELQVAISRREAEQILVEFLRGKVEFADDCAVRWLEDLLKHHLIQISNDRIEFRHQLIQEYYAAEWLLGLLPSLSDARLQQGYLNYLKWTEPLALVLELVEGEEQAVRVVRLALEVDLRLGARLAGAVKDKFQEKAINLVTEIEVSQLLKIELLGVTRSDKAIPYLLPFLSHEDFETRYTVAQAFGRIGSNSVVSALLPNLHHQTSSVRLATIKSLEKIPSEISVLELIAALQEPLADVRRTAASALGTIGIHTAGDALLESLNDKDSSVRCEAATSLGKIGGSKALLGLINLLGDRGFHVAVTAAYAIAEIDTSDVNEVDIVKAVDELTKFALKTDENQFIVAAVSALKALNHEAIPELILLNIDNEHPLVRANVAYALGESGNQEVVPILLNLLIDENNLVKAKAISALKNLNATEATLQLLNMFLNEKDGYIRACIVSTLGRFHVEESVNLLVNALDDPESQVRCNAAYALGKIPTNKAVQGILIALRHKDIAVRRNAIIAIKREKLKKKIFVQAISNMLIDEDDWIKAYACEAIGIIGDNEDITYILVALQDPIPTVRRGAIRALRKMGIDTKEVAEKLSSTARLKFRHSF
jgi:HEAT repeat protein